MAFSSNRYQQLGIADSTMILSDREREQLENSWAGDFARIIFPRIDENRFQDLYSTLSARPSSPVNVTIGGMILQQIFSQTDDELVGSVMCDVRFQYALHTTSALSSPLSKRTLQRFRKRVADYEKITGRNLIRECLEEFYGEMDTFLHKWFAGKNLDTAALIENMTRGGSLPFDYSMVSDPEIFKEHVMPAHSDHEAFSSQEALEAGKDDRRLSLNGLWKFHYAENYASAVPGFEKTSFDAAGWEEIRVPSHMQMEGYGHPAYLNYQYPWEGREEVGEGKVPARFNPVGSYIRFFEIPQDWKGQSVFVSFQGVESGFALWLNGRYVGYSEDSFTPSEFDLTPYLRGGINRMAVQVFTWTSGSWLEDQDMFRFSGIFRDVYLFTTPKIHIYDIKVRTLLDDSYQDADLAADLILTGRSVHGTVKYRLLSPSGKKVKEGAVPAERKVLIREKVSAPLLWSAEIPSLYDLYLDLYDEAGTLLECVRQRVGFRKFEIRDGIMCLNGKRIVFCGVNRHEFQSGQGRANMTAAAIREDLALMKRNNINAIRTSHYPNVSALYDLCDEYGLYMIAENNMETHGTWAAADGTKRVLDTRIPGDKEVWSGALLDRVNSCYQGQKNHPAILIWSVGNESHGGSVIRKMAQKFRELDPDRLVHYEGVFHDRTCADVSDMESQMYTSPEGVQQFIKEHPEKPFILCEYSHSMGNSNGNLYLYTEMADREPKYQGGFLWDFADQSIRSRDRFGKEYQAYGGDFMERPTDYSFSGNGIVAGDRMPYPKLQEIKFCYQRVQLQVGRDQVLVINRNLFLSTSAYTCTAVLERDGEEIAEGRIETDVMPGGQKAYALPFAVPEGPSGEYAVTVSLRLKEDTLWAGAGYETACGQNVFQVGEKKENAVSLLDSKNFAVIRGTFCTGVRGLDFSALLSFINGGGLKSYRYGGKEMILGEPRLNFWRALTDNDRGSMLGARCGEWKNASLYASIMPFDPAGESEEDRKAYPRFQAGKDSLDVQVLYFLPTSEKAQCLVTYRFRADGSVTFLLDYTPQKGLSSMPEFGMLLKLPPEYDQVEFYGYGPSECYCDRDHGARLGIYKTTAQESMTRYLVPQECGNHTGVRWAKVTDRKGRGVLFTALEGSGVDLWRGGMNFSALPWTPEEIENAAHHTELPPVHSTVIRCSLLQMGVGGDDSWGARTHDEFLLPADRPLHFAFSMKGI